MHLPDAVAKRMVVTDILNPCFCVARKEKYRHLVENFEVLQFIKQDNITDFPLYDSRL